MRNNGCRHVAYKLAVLLIAAVWGATLWGTEIQLKDGRALRGKLGRVGSVAESPQAAQPDSGAPLQNILFLDDELRRTFFSDRLVPGGGVNAEENRPLEEKFLLRQRVLHSGSTIKSVGSPMRVQPFDEYGRRIYTMNTGRGPIDIVQGITELTPDWTKVEGLKGAVWDMRIATSSIPRETLQKMLAKQINPKDPEQYKKVARFHIQCERYEEARKVLLDLVAAFPNKPDLKEQVAPSLRAIAQLAAQRLLNELKLRSDAGQHALATSLLGRFPTEGVGGEILQGVRTMGEDYAKRDARRKDVAKHLKTLAARVPDMIQRENLKPILDEITAEISLNTLDRMAAFLQNADDHDASESEKLSLAISGWLLGADAATPKLATAISAYKVRGMILEYLRATDAPERERVLAYFKQESDGDPATVAALLAHMKPPLDPPKPVADQPGFYEIETPGLTKGPAITYCLQLPPEYDPYRRYPAIITLGGLATTPQKQIDWWAGARSDDGVRAGQATRHGYIVIAPVWTAEHQKQYGYSAQELAAVLNPLRDACRRFSIDTDRVFLAGHSIGGDAAWDIGLAHPDLWAGVLPIVAQSERYCHLYWENARYVPFYFVAGELDGAKTARNAIDLDRYLRRGFDTTFVEYIGRGHEDFYDEILRMFDWMGRFRRNFHPRKFNCKTMRSWDNFFWWVEVRGLPSRSQVDPSDWPPSAGAQPVQIEGAINAKNRVNVQTGTSQVTVWLSPKLVDFSERSTVTVNGRRINSRDQKIQPDVRVMLEDVRTRGDRQNPFWARVEGSTGRALGD